MLRGDHGEFWLEPVALSPEEERVRLEEERLEDAGAEGRGAAGLYRNSVLGRPHLVFRRSVEQPQLEIGAASRARRRRKKKKKLERNCGTRGENPPTPFSPLPALPGLLSSPTFFSLLAFPPLFVFSSPSLPLLDSSRPSVSAPGSPFDPCFPFISPLEGVGEWTERRLLAVMYVCPTLFFLVLLETNSSRE